METAVEQVEWWWLLQRARRDPARFVERAAFHLFIVQATEGPDPANLLLLSARFVAQGQEVPVWLFR